VTEAALVADGIDHLSFSSAETFEDCPAKWAAHYIDGVRSEPGPEAIQGTMAHDVLEALAALDPGERTPARAREVVGELWEGIPKRDRRIAWAHVTRGLSMLEIVAGEVIGAELHLAAKLGGVPFTGRLDRADQAVDGVRILDYKAGKYPGRVEWMEPKYRQIQLYAAAYEEMFDRLVAEGAIVWLAPGRITEVPLERRDIRFAIEWLQRIWDRIIECFETDDWPAQPGPLCSWCPTCATCESGMVVIRARSKDASKSLGAYGIQALEEETVQRMSYTLAARQGKHLSVVPDP
jgi:putative RecB family exonuclease